MFCVSFSNVDPDPWAPSTLRRSGRRSRRSRNPYSNRGLDKFATVLADLKERRDKIVARMGQQHEVLLVRFMYSNAHDWVPIIVRLRDTKQQEKTQVARAGVHGQFRQGREAKKAIERSRSGFLGNKLDIVPSSQLPTPGPGQRMKRGLSWNVMGSGTKRGRPSHDLAVIVIVILLCLLISGRSFAIFATSGCWYLRPALRGHDQREAVSKPKEYGRTMSSGKGLGGDFRSSQSKKGALSPRYHGRER